MTRVAWISRACLSLSSSFFSSVLPSPFLRSQSGLACRRGARFAKRGDFVDKTILSVTIDGRVGKCHPFVPVAHFTAEASLSLRVCMVCRRVARGGVCGGGGLSVSCLPKEEECQGGNDGGMLFAKKRGGRGGVKGFSGRFANRAKIPPEQPRRAEKSVWEDQRPTKVTGVKCYFGTEDQQENLSDCRTSGKTFFIESNSLTTTGLHSCGP